MQGFKGTTFRQAMYQYQKEASNHIRSLFKELGVSYDDRGGFHEQDKDIWQADHNGRYRVIFKPFIPIKIKVLKSSLVPLSRDSDWASQKVYTNDLDTEVGGRHAYKTFSTREESNTSRNLVGLTVTNTFTAGTGEGASVKVENSTEISVSAEFESGSEKSHQKGREEETEITFTIPSNDEVTVEQIVDKSKIKSTETTLVYFQVAFGITGYKRQSRKASEWLNGSKDWRGYNGKTRLMAEFNSTDDFTNFIIGVNDRYPNQRKDLRRNSKVKKEYEWLLNNSCLQYIEEKEYNDASYGHCRVAD